MKIVPKRPTTKASADHFVGDVWIDRITDAPPPARIRVNVVRFAPGARNAWHAHPEGQTIHVTEGIGRVQSRSGEVIEIRAGDTVYTPPGEWHWHGAAPDHFMTHLAMWEGTDDRPDPEWGEPVTDEDYGRPALIPHRGSRTQGTRTSRRLGSPRSWDASHTDITGRTRPGPAR